MGTLCPQFSFCLQKCIVMRYTFLLALVLMASNVWSQDVVRLSSQPERTAEVSSRIEQIPNLTVSLPSASKAEVTFVDNSKTEFFPPIFDQQGNSCSQASGIRYIFSYHMNALRGTSAANTANVYSYHYTWNMLNNGTDMGSWYFDGFDLAKDNGVPSLDDFPDESFATNERTWMTGYDSYFRAMHNRIESYYKIQADAADGLSKIKRVLIDQGTGAATGGLLNFSGKTSNWQVVDYYGSSSTGYKKIVKLFGDGGDHAMTIAGFDDTVEFDINGDGVIQSDEKGALIMVNSWSSAWGDNGRAYMPYKLLTLGYWSGGIGNGDKYVYGIKVTDHKPLATAKVTIKYTSRNDLWFILGVASDASAQTQQKAKTLKVFRKQGGDFFMCGGNDESDKTIELGLDYSDLLVAMPNAKKFFLTVKQSPEGDLGTGQVLSWSVMDYRNAEQPVEHKASIEPVDISGTLSMSVAAVGSGISCNTLGKVGLSPNPANCSQLLELAIPNVTGTGMVSIYSLQGVCIHSVNADFAADRAILYLPSAIPAGLYVVKVNVNNMVYSGKLVIK